MPTLYILAGPNGAGKTTAAGFLLPDVFQTNIFINADVIAAQLSPQNPGAVAFKAGRIHAGAGAGNLNVKANLCHRNHVGN